MRLIRNDFESSSYFDNRPGYYHIQRAGDGRAVSITVRCPCGCGAERCLPLEPTTVAEAWALHGPDTVASLYPEVRFEAADRRGAEHWVGWLVGGRWYDTREAPKIALVNHRFNVVEAESALPARPSGR